MNQLFTNWFREQATPDKVSTLKAKWPPNTPCGDKKRCAQILQNLLDDQATMEELEFMQTHVFDCLPCYERYDLDAIIKSKLKLVPPYSPKADLLNDIRRRIQDDKGEA